MKIKTLKSLTGTSTGRVKRKKITIDGYTFDSTDEGNRYIELKDFLEVGKIKDLELQPKFLLMKGFKIGDKKIQDIYYISDFKYIENGKTIIEDVKSDYTSGFEVYRLKKKLFIKQYILPNIDTWEFREHYMNVAPNIRKKKGEKVYGKQHKV